MGIWVVAVQDQLLKKSIKRRGKMVVVFMWIVLEKRRLFNFQYEWKKLLYFCCVIDVNIVFCTLFFKYSKNAPGSNFFVLPRWKQILSPSTKILLAVIEKDIIYLCGRGIINKMTASILPWRVTTRVFLKIMWSGIYYTDKSLKFAFCSLLSEFGKYQLWSLNFRFSIVVSTVGYVIE